MLAILQTAGKREPLVGSVKLALPKFCLTTPELAINRPVAQPITLTPVKPPAKPAVILVPKATPVPAVGNVAVRQNVRPIIRRKVRVLPPKPVIH